MAAIGREAAVRKTPSQAVDSFSGHSRPSLSSFARRLGIDTTQRYARSRKSLRSIAYCPSLRVIDLGERLSISREMS